MKFGYRLHKYTILKLSLNRYRCTAHCLGIDFQIAGAEVREKIRKDEKRLLKLNFDNWAQAYYGNLKGWRHDSPIYALRRGRVVSGLYLCDKNEFNDDPSWGQLHYFFTDPAFKRRGLHSMLFGEAIERAKSWHLEGVIISTDRYLLPEVYIRWGAIPWKEIRKVQSHKTPIALAKTFLKRACKPIRVLRRYL